MSSRLTHVYIYILFLCFGHSQIFARTTAEVFIRYPNQVFIETGSFLGDGIKMALQAGFKEIHSIEISSKHYQYCCQCFENNPKVHLYYGDSTEVLPKILAKLKKRATFWLDGHYSWGDTGKGKTNTPILEELKIIATHPINSHTIMIDDLRLFGTHQFDYIELNKIFDLLLAINPKYHFSHEDGYIKNDVLVAEIKEKISN